MSINKVTNLSDLKPYKTAWKIEVKVLHSWKQYTAQSGETLEMVFADQHGTKIHASCKKTWISKLERHLPVGKWRIIQNFSLTTSTGLYRSTEHVNKFIFINNTSVDLSTIRDDNMFLSIVDFETIISGSLQTWFLIDVIGQVLDVSEIQTVLCAGKEKKKLEFTLRDVNDQRIAFCLWGKFAEMVYSACEKAEDGIVICLVRFAKIGKYREKLQISNAYDASQVLIDPDTEETKILKQMFTQDCNSITIFGDTEQKLELTVQQDTWNQYPHMTLSEIVNATEVTRITVICSIFAIDKDWGWYYFGCGICDKKVTKVDPPAIAKKTKEITTHVWYCEQCGCKVPYARHRFKLHLIVGDETAMSKFMLLDTPATFIITKSAKVLLNGSFDELEDPENLPEEIESLVGKSFKFGVSIEKENIQYGKDFYKAMKVWNVDDMTMSGSATLQDSQSIRENTIISSSEESLLLTDGNNNSEDLATPSSKRSQEEDAPDLNSTSKKQCTKVIKLEKMTEEELKKK